MAKESAVSDSPTVSVAVIGICGAGHIARCLDALEGQIGAPAFEAIVVYDPQVRDVTAITDRYRNVRFVANRGQRSPLELASTAVRHAQGDIILLTEDHCVPRADWVRVMTEASTPDRAAVGGRVEVARGATFTDWAFYFVDFYRYASPAREGPSPSLSVCNACYRREQVDEIQGLWSTYFHETAVNEALRERFGALWFEPESEVTMARHVRLRHALAERYAFGRLFSCTRIGFVSAPRRLYYALLAPTLPALLLYRMGRKALRSRRLTKNYARACVPLVLMTLSWSWGEWLGYLTGRHPKSLAVAPEIGSVKRTAGEQ